MSADNTDCVDCLTNKYAAEQARQNKVKERVALVARIKELELDLAAANTRLHDEYDRGYDDGYKDAEDGR